MSHKTFIFASAGIAAIVGPGCAFVGLEDLTPNWHETRALSEEYKVINPKAQGVGKIHQVSLIVIPLCRWGGSFEAAYQDALKKNPGSDDIINVRSNMSGLNFLFYQLYDVNIYGAAIQYDRTPGAPAAP